MSPSTWHRIWLVASAVAIGAIIFAWISLLRGDYFHDAKAYWSVDYANLYGGSLVGRFGTYLYSPAFAQAMWPLTLLPWTVFAAVWSALNLALLIWMARPILAALCYSSLSPRWPMSSRRATFICCWRRRSS